jgi:cell wall-associated NlpC family hydrolase
MLGAVLIAALAMSVVLISQPSSDQVVGDRAAAAASPAPAKDGVRARAPATIAVSVGTVWGDPSYVRPVDLPSLENPVRYRTWLKDMTKEERSDLGPTRVHTSVLFGELVQVLAISGEWAQVVVPSQASPRDPRGYPGWIPVRQLSHRVPPADALVATVTAKTTMLKTREGTDVLEISYATRLPAVAAGSDAVEVWSPDARTLFVAAEDVVVKGAAEPALPKTAASIVKDARRFLRLAYLWDGSSAFGFDCSGITYSVFRTHGILLPRDSFGQATVGKEIDRSNLRSGDLLFFAKDGTVHHVGIYVGGDRMLHAYKTGEPVQISSILEGWYAEEYFAARRYL